MRVQLLRPADAVADTAAPLLERESSLALLNEYAAQAAGATRSASRSAIWPHSGAPGASG